MCRTVRLVICLLALASVTACWSTPDDDDEISIAGDAGPCTADAGDMFRCNGSVLQRCDGESWTTVEDCASSGRSCEVGDEGNADCAGDRECETGESDGKCNPGSQCAKDADCASGVCGDNRLCLPATCSNGEQDGDETGPDCGGSCPKCVGEPCSENEHCTTNYCKNKACASPSCTDKVKNGTETGNDCGGECSPCPTGEGCVRDADCETGRCDGGTCADLPATCNDGEKNGSETDIDCGGSDCGACPLDRTCKEDGDCLSSFCNFGVCNRPTCDDMIQNQGESDEDCGGDACPACPVGKACEGNNDCQSGRCASGSCVSCSDGTKNGGETGTDCGGPCAACAEGETCESDGDCASERCTNGTCTSCNDGTKNGDEAGVDCGGSCNACDDGASCERDSDCSGGRCKGGTCCTPNRCGDCGPLPQETCNGKDDDCDGQTDERLDHAAPDCPNQKGVCGGAKKECRGAQGWVCDDQTYASHNSAYQTDGDKPCDERDNDCDGETDEDPCPDDGDPCTTERCFSNSCSSYQGGQEGTPCGSSRNTNRQKMQFCDYQCTYYDDVCICNSSGCTLYNYVPSGMYSGVHTTNVTSCGCYDAYSGARYDYVMRMKRPDGTTRRETCRSACNEHTDGNTTYYSCE